MKRKTLATLNAGKDTRLQELSFISNGNTIVCAATLKNSLAVSYITTCALTIQQWFTLIFTEKNWTLLSIQKSSAVYNSFIRHCQNLEATKVYFSKWMVNKLTYPSNGKLFRAKRVIKLREDTEETYTHITKWKANLKSLFTGWFQLNYILEKAKPGRQYKDQ